MGCAGRSCRGWGGAWSAWLARFDPVTGELDLAHLASLIDARTKLVCCTGASNFLGTRPRWPRCARWPVRAGTPEPNGERRSYLLVDGAQLVPGSFVDVRALDVDFLAFTFHKLLAPFGVGVLYGKQHLLEGVLPFLYGGDMIAEGQVFPDRVGYNGLPWKYAAGTPNILGAIVSAQAVRLLLDLALSPRRPVYFGTGKPFARNAVHEAMGRVTAWNRQLTARALAGRPPSRGSPSTGRARRHGAPRWSRSTCPAATRSWRPSCWTGPGSRPGPVCHCATLGPPRPQTRPARQLPAQLLPLQHPSEVYRAVAAVAAIASGHHQPTTPVVPAPHPAARYRPARSPIRV